MGAILFVGVPPSELLLLLESSVLMEPLLELSDEEAEEEVEVSLVLPEEEPGVSAVSRTT